MSRTTALAALLLAAPLAQAADNGFYVGAGVTQSDYGLSNPNNAEPFDDKDGGWKLIAGWRPLDNFGIEASYADHGDAVISSGIVCIDWINAPCPTDTGLSAKTTTAFAVGYLDFPFVDLFAKAGVNAWELDGKSDMSATPFRFDESGSGFAWGVGVQARLRSLAARLEYEQFDVISDEKLGVISLSLTWTFL
jgi:opacity protein-like surface antigen